MTAKKEKHGAAAEQPTAGETERAAPAAMASAPSDGEAIEPRFPVVGIGASAGGLDAFRKFFSNMPANSGLAFVLIPHLDPSHESLMAELLARSTTMPVVEAKEEMSVEANRVYILPPNKYMTIGGGKLHLTGPVLRGGLQTSIDLFLRSLAADRREQAICIILSGTGAHGTLGLKAIKANGGMAMVQEPKTAEYDRMPQNAIATGQADYVLPPEQMAQALIQYTQHFFVNGAKPSEAPEQTHLNQILTLLRVFTKLDFHCYRQKMLVRRIERRMGLHYIEGITAYLAFLNEHPEETMLLAKDLLISVTNFFRDAEAFQELESQVIPPLVQSKDATEGSLRVWVPGCATGEEAYSIAMLLIEHLDASRKNCRLQIFATDVDEEALNVGRQGIYPEIIAADVSVARLRRFFTRVGDHSYQVNKQLREAVTFAVQNVLADAPFSKLDLIACRNLLIYLEPDVQQKILALFHFALLEGGYLFLGPSETVGQQTNLFEPVSKKWRIYRHIGPRRATQVDFPIVVGGELRSTSRRLLRPAGGRPAGFPELTQRLLLETFAPAAVLINRKGEILYFHGPTMRYLDQPTGEPTRDLLAMARDGLRAKLRATIHQAIRDSQQSLVTHARLPRGGAYVTVKVTVIPVQVPKDAERLLLVTFADEAEPSSLRSSSTEGAGDESVARQLEIELKTTRDELQNTIEELESSNEDLKASNEEMMSMNEELQASNEELETSKEEMQSLNEELSTSNTQLKDKVAEVEAANNDLANFLSNTDVATVFLDTDFRIRRFTQAATRLFSLIATDLGRPLHDITCKFTDDDLQHDLEEVLRSLKPREKEVPADEGRWYLRRIMPYRTRDDHVEGVVLTFTDVTRLKEAAGIQSRLEREILEIATLEQRRIGHDLHDTVGQELTALSLMAHSLMVTLRENSSPEVPLADKIAQGIQRTFSQVRSLSRGLIPVEVDAHGLMAALAELMTRLNGESGVLCTFVCENPVPVGNNVTATHLYRIAQEAVSNALKHGRAKHIEVGLSLTGGLLTLRITDDGVGIQNRQKKDEGLGFRIMRYRADLIRANLAIGSAAQGGTLVSCILNEEMTHEPK